MDDFVESAAEFLDRDEVIVRIPGQGTDRGDDAKIDGTRGDLFDGRQADLSVAVVPQGHGDVFLEQGDVGGASEALCGAIDIAHDAGRILSLRRSCRIRLPRNLWLRPTP